MVSKIYKKVLVTGGAGCIGIEVVKQLKKSGFQPIIYDLTEKILQIKKYVNLNAFYCGSILDYSLLIKAMSTVDHVIHLAAHLGVERTEAEPYRCLEINIEGTKNVLNAAISSKVKKIVFASSSEVYGEPIEPSVNEESLTQGKTVYAISKLAGEEYLKAICKDNKYTKGIIVRYFNTFGPYQTAQFVIPKFINLVKDNKQPIINGNGMQIRSYCYVSDSAIGTVKALEYNFKPKKKIEVFNIGNPDNKISVKNLAKKIIKISDNNLEPYFNENFKGTDRQEQREIYSRICDISKAKSLLNFKPKTILDIGLKKTFNSEHLWIDWPVELK